MGLELGSVYSGRCGEESRSAFPRSFGSFWLGCFLSPFRWSSSGCVLLLYFACCFVRCLASSVLAVSLLLVAGRLDVVEWMRDSWPGRVDLWTMGEDDAEVGFLV